MEGENLQGYEAVMNIINILFDAAMLASNLLIKTLPFMIVGVLIAELIVALRITDRISVAARPITSFTHLKHECGAAFMMAFISANSANAMLASYYNNNVIEKKELFIASMLNSFPAIVMHWRPLLPVLIPLLGTTGLIYFGMLMVVGLLKTSIIMVAGRFLLDGNDCSNTNNQFAERPSLKDASRKSLQASMPTIKKIVTMTVVTMFIVAVLIKIGVFDALTSHLGGVCTYFPIPVAGLSIIAAQFAHYIAACTVASGLMSTGELTSKDVIIVLLVGTVLTSITQAVKWFIPSYVGLFGPKMGTQLIILSTAIMDGITLLLIFALALFWQ